jgi:HSP20 family protein
MNTEHENHGAVQRVQQHQPNARRPYVAPRVDVYETSDAFVVTADVPGASESALDITLEKDRLTIEAPVDLPRRDDHRLRLAESSAGGYMRSFALPDGIDRDRIAANVKDGILSLTLPKSDAVRPRKITVQAAG